MAKILKWLIGLAVLGLGGLLVAGAIVYFAVMPGLPDVTELKRIDWQMPLTVYSRDGKFIAEFGETRRYPVHIDDVPARTKNAVIAVEDAHFYKHIGVDWRGIVRAVWLTASTSDSRVPGGSTITQQVARNFYLTNEYSYFRKLKEMLLALKMEKELTKDEILGLYLNKIFFGNRSYGIVAAADYYYGKKLSQLSLAETATLAGIPKFPSSGNPISNPERSMIRRDYILQRMAEEGFISRDEMLAAQAEPNTAKRHEQPTQLHAPYLAEMVRIEMVRRYGERASTGGFRVTTTVHSKDQLAAEQAVRTGLMQYDRRHGWRGAEAKIALAGKSRPELKAELRRLPLIDWLPAALVLSASNSRATLLLVDGREVDIGASAADGTGKSLSGAVKAGDVVRLDKSGGNYRLAQIPAAQAALVSLQPEDGALRAIVGGFSYSTSNFNRVTSAKRQPGSSFKPFVYAASFDRGYSPSSVVLDAPVVFKDRKGNVWRPQNDRGGFRGPMRLREALVQSRNLVSVRLLDGIGVNYARDYITKFGFSKTSLPANLSMSLGTASLTPLSIARGYTVLANGGYLVEPYFIQSISNSNGVMVAYTHPKRACALCPERLAGDVSKATVVDGFDLSSEGLKTEELIGSSASFDPSFVGPSEVALAPHTVDARNAYMISDMMLDVVKRGTAVEAMVLERADIGGKTGSTNDHRDAWFSGFGGDLVTTVWVGKDNYKTLGYGEYGGRAALPIWINYMREALQDVPLKNMDPPSGLVKSANGEYHKAEQYDQEMQGVPSSENYKDYSEQAYDIF
ncbi:MAG TPA: penicillin-binding protein 1A [Arenimonas sp.]|nr:penicillin-binding protein 1A [Arenimonas sp.]